MSLTGNAAGILQGIFGSGSNITLEMKTAVERAERKIHSVHVRPITLDEAVEALKDAGIELPSGEVEQVEPEKAPTPANETPIVAVWEEVADGTRVEFEDERNELHAGVFHGINEEDGTLMVSTKIEDETVHGNIARENVRLVPVG